jgi:hypothetical protein
MENETEKEEVKTPNMVGEAYQAAERLRIENARMEQNIKTLQDMKAFEVLGGKTEGKPQEEKPQEISPKEYSRLLLEGKLPLK